MSKGVGLDIGTMNLVAARNTGKAVETQRIRDAFLDLPANAKKVLKLSGANYVEHNGDLLLIGDDALELANVFGREARRPLSKGLVSSQEADSLDVLAHMIKKLLGAPKEKGEHCYYSIPAAPVDNPERDVIYHKRVFERIVANCGYTATPSNEAMAIVFSECAADGFSGLSFSFGSGMTNIALAYHAVEAMTFSVERGGDWIDGGAATALGGTAARMCALKEAGVDLMNPVGREQEALVFYYKELVDYALTWAGNEFLRRGLEQTVTRPVPIVISGGTSTAIGFLDLFNSVLERKRKKFPLKVTEVRAASEPFDAVARGLLVQAHQEYEE
jgi:hypothetical protein